MGPRAILLIPALLLLSCHDEPPGPSILTLDTESEVHAQLLLSSLTETPILAPEASMFPGLFEVYEADVSTLVLTAHAQAARARADRTKALAHFLSAVIAGKGPRDEVSPARAACLADARRHAYRLYFIDRAADEHRGHAPGGSAAKRIAVQADRLRISLVGRRDPTLPAREREIRRRLTHTAFSPCTPAETGPYRRVNGPARDAGSPAPPPADNGDSEAGVGPLSHLPAIVEIRVNGELDTLLSRADLYRREGRSIPEIRSDAGDERSRAATGRLHAVGTRYDLLVANTESSRLPDMRAREKLLVETRRAVSGLAARPKNLSDAIDEPIRVLEPPGATGTFVESGAVGSVVRELGLDVKIAGGAGGGDGAGDDAGDAAAGDAKDAATAYRRALFSGDYDLARIVWASESAHDSEVLRMFRSFDPRNYASLSDEAFDALVESNSDAARRYLEEQGAVTILARDLHRVDWTLHTDPRDEAAAEVRRTVESGLWLDAFGQLWFMR